jgi:hypothetical protein
MQSEIKSDLYGVLAAVEAQALINPRIMVWISKIENGRGFRAQMNDAPSEEPEVVTST